jgi:hypothetical protein
MPLPRYIKQTVVLAKIETTYGVDAVPTGALNAMQISEVEIVPLEAKYIPLNFIQGYFGNSPELVGTSFSKIKFKVFLGGSGTPAIAPAWGCLFVAGANSELTGLTTPNRVEYPAASDLLRSLTMYVHDSGLLHKLLGCMVGLTLSAKSGEPAYAIVEGMAINGGETVIGNAVPVLTNWKLPVPITKANVTKDITLGCAYTAGALTGGTSYNSSGLSLNYGNDLAFSDLLTEEAIDLTDRKMTGSFSIQVSPTEEAAFYTSIRNNVLTSVGFAIGTVPGYKLMLFMSSVQLKMPKKEVFNGKRMMGYDMVINPLAGNDDIRLILT